MSTLCMRSIILSSLNKCHDQMADDPESTTDPEPEPRPETISDRQLNSENDPYPNVAVIDPESRPEKISNPSRNQSGTESGDRNRIRRPEPNPEDE